MSSRPTSPGDAERLARVALNRITEPGDPRLVALVAEVGAVRVHEHLAGERDIAGMLTDTAARMAEVDPERELEQAARLGIRFVIPGDDEWPASLDDLGVAEPLQNRGGSPLGLWIRGPVRLEQLARSVSIVGSRSATTYGADTAAEMASVIARAGFCVVSGAAFGIDQAAHRGALAGGGPTVAVLACGADRVYPAAHRRLLAHLGEQGAIISEAAPGCAPTRIRFLARNRIIAALSGGTVVVEAAVRSGALNTANWAERLLRPLMGVPGPVTSAPSQGVHQLIRSGAASLVTSGEEVLEQVGGAGEHLVEVPRGPTRVRDRLTLRHQQVLDAVPVVRGAPVDSVARTAGIGLVEVRSALGALARLGLVEQSGVGWRLTDAAR
ncbi:DNA-processing protein DprA [Nocardioides pacificus]